MYIFSLDRKTILKASKLSVSKNYGGKKDGKYVVVAESTGGLIGEIAGVFPDEKTAIDALEKAYQAFADDRSPAGSAKFYKFD